jgi:hypothetical protein
MPANDQPTSDPAIASAQPDRSGASPTIDLQALAERLYELMKREARIERERAGKQQ